MLAGIVLVALGMKQVVEYVGGAGDHTLADPLALLPLCIMYGGVALYLVAHVAFKYRNWRTVSVPRVVAATASSHADPRCSVPALGGLGLLDRADGRDGRLRGGHVLRVAGTRPP